MSTLLFPASRLARNLSMTIFNRIESWKIKISCSGSFSWNLYTVRVCGCMWSFIWTPLRKRLQYKRYITTPHPNITESPFERWHSGTFRHPHSACAKPEPRPPQVQTSCSSPGSRSSLSGPRSQPCRTPLSALPPLRWAGDQQSASLSRRCSPDSPQPVKSKETSERDTLKRTHINQSPQTDYRKHFVVSNDNECTSVLTLGNLAHQELATLGVRHNAGCGACTLCVWDHGRRTGLAVRKVMDCEASSNHPNIPQHKQLMLQKISLLGAQHLQWSDLQTITKLQNLHSSHSGVGGAKVDANHLLTRGHFCAGSNLIRLTCNDSQMPYAAMMYWRCQLKAIVSRNSRIEDCASMSRAS